MRRTTAAVLATTAVSAAGAALWWRWLQRRAAVWRERLTDAVPVHADWWRTRAGRSGAGHLVTIGDSAAQGIGASRPDRSWVGQLAAHLGETTGAPWRVTNLSVSGSTVYGAYRDQLPQLAVIDPAPDLVVVCIGANNIADFSPARFEKDLRRLLAGLPADAIVADLPSFHLPPREHRVREANGIVHRLVAERGLTLVPLYEATRRQGAWGVLTQFSGDLFHPNDRGYRVWSRAFLPAARERIAGLADRIRPAGSVPPAASASAPRTTPPASSAPSAPSASKEPS
jgi:acyl-CoA thioesterase I